jgi:1,4-alpha-glucan branching enzyme
MGCEFGQSGGVEFRTKDWHCYNTLIIVVLKKLITDLNGLYRSEPALYENNFLQKV